MRAFALLVVGLCGTLVAAAQPFSLAQLQYLGEVGHLGTSLDERMSVAIAGVHVSLEAEGVLIQGADDSGQSWSAALSAQGGAGWTDVWRADFDQNGRPDLLIAAYFPLNGRCTGGITLSFLLFTGHGQPVPWVIRTQMAENERPVIPALFADVNHDGRTEVVVTDCSYSSGPGDGEEWRITGVYQAQDAAWSLIRPSALEPYAAIVRSSHSFRPGYSELLPADPSRWPEQGNKLDPHGDPPAQVTALLPGSGDCSPVSLPPIVDGAFQAGWEDPCKETGRDRFQLSNGTVCFGWPTMILDRADGREIITQGERWKRALQEIIEQNRTVVLVGQNDPDRCSPSVLWALSIPPD